MADGEDDDVLDSWEEAAESGELERRMEEREKQLKKETESTQEHIEMTPTTVGQVKILKAENLGRTEYTPQIKILKRSGNLETKKNIVKQSSEAELKKTLKLREAEYQAARNRILGEDYDETKPKLECELPNDGKISIIKPPARLSPSTPSPNSSGPSGVRLLTTPGSNRTVDNTAVRQPSGPDSTCCGFSVKR